MQLRGVLGIWDEVGDWVGENLIEFCKPAHIWDVGSARQRRAATRGASELREGFARVVEKTLLNFVNRLTFGM